MLHLLHARSHSCRSFRRTEKKFTFISQPVLSEIFQNRFSQEYFISRSHDRLCNRFTTCYFSGLKHWKISETLVSDQKFTCRWSYRFSLFQTAGLQASPAQYSTWYSRSSLEGSSSLLVTMSKLAQHSNLTWGPGPNRRCLFLLHLNSIILSYSRPSSTKLTLTERWVSCAVKTIC